MGDTLEGLKLIASYYYSYIVVRDLSTCINKIDNSETKRSQCLAYNKQNRVSTYGPSAMYTFVWASRFFCSM